MARIKDESVNEKRESKEKMKEGREREAKNRASAKNQRRRTESKAIYPR